MISYEDAKKKKIVTLEALTAELGAGREVSVFSGGTLVKTLKWSSRANGKHEKRVYVHGGYARNLEQVSQYVSGDAHDRSKIEFFDGLVLHPWF